MNPELDARDGHGLPEIGWNGGFIAGVEVRPWLLDKGPVGIANIRRMFAHLPLNEASREMRQWARKNIQNRNIERKSYRNADMGWPIMIEGRGIKKAISYRLRDRAEIELVSGLPSLIENAVRDRTESEV